MSQQIPKHKFSVKVGTNGVQIGFEREWQANFVFINPDDN